jgi:hypothetical protein
MQNKKKEREKNNSKYGEKEKKEMKITRVG